LIFALVVSALTLVVCLILSMRYTLYTHIGCIAVMAILWLALASYTTDRIGYVQCEALDGQVRSASNTNGHYNSVSWCRELKAMMAFAWFVWGLFMIAIVSWIRLSEHEENTYGEGSEHDRHEERAAEEEEHQEERYARRENLEAGGGPRFVSTIPQYQTGYQNGAIPLQQGMTGLQPGMTGLQQGMTGLPQGNVIYQQPGHAVVVQNGQVTQVPQGYAVQGMQQPIQMQQQPMQQRMF